MSYPAAYEPMQGYRYQILSKYSNEPYEHCDYAKDRTEKEYLLGEYNLAYGRGYSFKVIELPQKYWE